MKNGKHLCTSAALLIVQPTLDTGDREFILSALDLLERFTRDELENKPNKLRQAAMINMRSGLLIVRAKMRVLRESKS